MVILLLSTLLFYTMIGLAGNRSGSLRTMVYYIVWSKRRRSREMDLYLEKLSFNMDLATKNAILTVPMPVVVTDVEGTIIWYNAHFEEVVKKDSIIGNNLGGYMPGLNFSRLIDSSNEFERVEFRDEIYRVTCSPVQIDKEIDDSRVLLLFYWQDITDQTLVEERYKKEQLVLAHVYVDNYDEVLAHTEGPERPMVIAEIDGRLGKWASRLNAGWQKYDRDKFL